jgi:hypothetical protein
MRQAENTPPTDNWVIYNRTATPNTATFRTGPGTPPLGTGSLELSVPTGGDKVTAFNYDYNATKLSMIDAMGYSTYRTSGSAQQVAALNIQVDINGAASGGFTTLVFEPVYNTTQGVVVNDTWQNWDAYKGGEAIWWSSNPIPGAPNRDTFVSWNSILALNPDATILGGYGINQGSGNVALTTAVDKLIIGVSGNTTTYDFEVVRPAAAVPTGLKWSNPDVACGGTTSSNTITANWDDVVGATKYRYSVNTPTTYATTPWETSGATDPTISERPGEFTDGEGVYTFRVASINSDGTVSAFSTDCSITYKKAVVTPPAPVTPASKEACKNNGYAALVTADGKKFKNQGDCVSYVATGGKVKGAPVEQPSTLQRAVDKIKDLFS